jgi:hypothetical protein
MKQIANHSHRDLDFVPLDETDFKTMYIAIYMLCAL